MSPEEQHDLEVMKIAQQQIKLNCFDLMTMLSRPDTDLIACGYRNGLGAALVKVHDTAHRELGMLARQHIKKYPDQ